MRKLQCEALPNLNPATMDDLLTAHGLMMSDVLKNAGSPVVYFIMSLSLFTLSQMVTDAWGDCGKF